MSEQTFTTLPLETLDINQEIQIPATEVPFNSVRDYVVDWLTDRNMAHKSRIRLEVRRTINSVVVTRLPDWEVHSLPEGSLLSNGKVYNPIKPPEETYTGKLPGLKVGESYSIPSIAKIRSIRRSVWAFSKKWFPDRKFSVLARRQNGSLSRVTLITRVQ